MILGDVIAYDAVQHTANYTPGYVAPNSTYVATTVDLPLITYTGFGNIQTVSSINNTGDNVPNSSSVINGKDLIVSLNFEDTETKQELTLTQITYVGQVYASESKIIPADSSVAEGFFGVVEVSNKPNNYVIKIEFQEYWLSATGVLSVSDGTLAQSNAISDWNIQANIDAITAFILSGARITMVPILNAGINNDENVLLESTTLTYDFFAIPVGCDQCTLYGFVTDNCNDIVSGTVTVKTEEPILTQGVTAAFEETVDIRTDVSGFFEMPLIIPNLPGPVAEEDKDFYLYEAVWIDSDGKEWKQFGTLDIPNQTTVLFNDAFIPDE